MNVATLALIRHHPRLWPAALKYWFDEYAEHFYCQALMKTQYAKSEDLRNLQLKRLQRLIQYAYHHVPFWKDFLAKNDCSPPWPKTLEDFSRLPTVSKRDFRIRPWREYLSDEVPANDLIERATTGSSGIPLRIFLDRNFFIRRKAQYRRQLLWAGKQKGDQVIRILPYDYLEIEDCGIYFACKEPMGLIDQRQRLYALLEQKPTIIHSYLSMLVQLARLFHLDQRKFSIRAVITHAEQLTPEIRNFLESVFHAPVLDYFACNEVHSVAQECEQKLGMHLNAELVYAEVVDDDDRALRDGQTGHLVLTGFDNVAMPFIRYRTGDMARFLPNQCNCGRGLPRIDFVGRALSSFPLPNKRNGHLFELFVPIHQRVEKIFQYQIRQEAIDRFVLRVVPTQLFREEDQHEIASYMRSYLGPHVAFYCEIVDYIESIRGKEQVFISVFTADEKEKGAPVDWKPL